MIVAFSAVMISFVALGVGIYEAHLERSFHSASVWPRVEVFRSYNSKRFSYVVINSGIGPAIVKSAKVSLNDRYFSNWKEAVTATTQASPAEVFVGNSHISNRVISPDKELDILTISDKALAKLLAQSDNLAIELCYCSVFDECWVTDRNNKPRPIGNCAVEETQMFQQ